MYAGYDRVCGYQLYCSDPSGNYAAWKAHATGKGSTSAISMLKEEHNEDCTLAEAVIQAAKVLTKAMELTTPDPKKFEIGILHHKDGKLV